MTTATRRAVSALAAFSLATAAAVTGATAASAATGTYGWRVTAGTEALQTTERLGPDNTTQSANHSFGRGYISTPNVPTSGPPGSNTYIETQEYGSPSTGTQVGTAIGSGTVTVPSETLNDGTGGTNLVLDVNGGSVSSTASQVTTRPLTAFLPASGVAALRADLDTRGTDLGAALDQAITDLSTMWAAEVAANPNGPEANYLNQLRAARTRTTTLSGDVLDKPAGTGSGFRTSGATTSGASPTATSTTGFDRITVANFLDVTGFSATAALTANPDGTSSGSFSQSAGYGVAALALPVVTDGSGQVAALDLSSLPASVQASAQSSLGGVQSRLVGLAGSLGAAASTQPGYDGTGTSGNPFVATAGSGFFVNPALARYTDGIVFGFGSAGVRATAQQIPAGAVTVTVGTATVPSVDGSYAFHVACKDNFGNPVYTTDLPVTVSGGTGAAQTVLLDSTLSCTVTPTAAPGGDPSVVSPQSLTVSPGATAAFTNNAPVVAPAPAASPTASPTASPAASATPTATISPSPSPSASSPAPVVLSPAPAVQTPPRTAPFGLLDSSPSDGSNVAPASPVTYRLDAFNFSDAPVTVELRLPVPSGAVLVSAKAGTTALPPRFDDVPLVAGEARTTVTIPAHGSADLTARATVTSGAGGTVTETGYVDGKATNSSVLHVVSATAPPCSVSSTTPLCVSVTITSGAPILCRLSVTINSTRPGTDPRIGSAVVLDPRSTVNRTLRPGSKPELCFGGKDQLPVVPRADDLLSEVLYDSTTSDGITTSTLKAGTVLGRYEFTVTEKAVACEVDDAGLVTACTDPYVNQSTDAKATVLCYGPVPGFPTVDPALLTAAGCAKTQVVTPTPTPTPTLPTPTPPVVTPTPTTPPAPRIESGGGWAAPQPETGFPYELLALLLLPALALVRRAHRA